MSSHDRAFWSAACVADTVVLDGEVVELCFRVGPLHNDGENQDGPWEAHTLSNVRPYTARSCKAGTARNNDQWLTPSIDDEIHIPWGERSGNAPLPGQKVERRVAVRWHPPQPAGELRGSGVVPCLAAVR